MNTSTSTVRSFRARLRVASVFILCGAFACGVATGQSVAPAPAARPPATSAPKPDEVNRTAADATKSAKASGEVVELSAFEVQADSDRSYGALNSASITRFNVEMDKLPVSADIFTETFMKDIAVTSVEDVVQGYSAGAGYASGVDNGSSSGASNQPGDRNGNAYIQIRGMNTPAMQRDGFMPVGAFGNPGSTGVGRTDNFDLERVEVINGPQALLYGGGGAGGVINVTSKQARFGRSDRFFSNPRGEALFRVDHYGSKRGELDFGFGNTWFATRVAFMKESLSSRRINIGSTTSGQYGQLAFRFFQRTVPTTIRLSTQQTMNRRRLVVSPTLIAPATDTRNGLLLHYVLATNQQGDTNPITGARYTSGAILNGKLNWSNVDSFGAGVMYQEPVSNDYSSVTIDTKWSTWLTTQVAAGYDDYTDRRINPGFSFFAPNAAANTSGNWSAGLTPSDSWQPARTKGGRVAAVITKDLFQGRAKTQTLIGADYIRTDFGQIAYNWFEADSNWNVRTLPNTTITSTNSGRIPVPQLRWSINDGPVLYPFDNPGRDRAVWNGVNYVRALTNQPQPNLVTPANPLGVPFTNSNYIQTKIFNKGLYGVNYTQWFGGKLNTLMGVRQGDYISDRFQHPSGASRWLTIASRTNFNLGVDYIVNRWLHPYINYSDSVQPPFLANSSDPYSRPPTSSHGIGGEFGLKINNTQNTLSGSLAYYKVSAESDLYSVNGAIRDEINPAGLNGGGGGTTVNVDRVTKGLELRFTAAPTRSWRIRVSAATTDGEIGTAKAYDQVYNDQFYANATGQITYRDNSPVYVNGAATTAAQAVVVPSTATGATPLTINMISTPGNIYFANPDLISGRIASGSTAATVLRTVDPVRGPILTGATFLPISQLQISKALSGVNPPGVIVATRVGDKTTGYPEYSANFTNHYTFTGENWLKGLSVGGTVNLSWRNRAYYYYATPVNAANALTLRRTLHYTPDTQQFNAIIGYARKFGRYNWSTQLNVANVFNHYQIRLVPNATSGFNTLSAINATWYQQPRAYQWTNSVRF